MTQMEAKTVTVECIVTFEDYAKEQEMFEFETFIQPLNKTVDDQLPVELELIGEVIDLIEAEDDWPPYDLATISLALTGPDGLDSIRASHEELKEMGFGFAHRNSLKYYFKPDPKELLVKKENGFASETLPFRVLCSQYKVNIPSPTQH